MNLPERHWDTEQQRWVYPGELPPLPEPWHTYRYADGRQNPLYSAEQMRAYGESCARMAREEERALTNAMGVAWVAQLEAFGMDKDLALKMVTETVDKLAAAIRKG